jgi:hypothetical protein
MKNVLVLMALSCACALGCSEPTNEEPVQVPPSWQTVLDHDDLDRVPLSIWGASANEVFAVGGSLGNGADALALYFDGQTWIDLQPGGTETLWWVSGTSANDVWMVGEGGRVTHWNGSGFDSHDVGTTANLWGVLALADNDVWVVGGTPMGGSLEPNDIVLHYDGVGWAPVALPTPQGAAYYKVWGTAPNNLYVVGEIGTIWHRTGAGWVLESDGSSIDSTLFTVHGCGPDEVYAVGGHHLLSSNGDGGWTDVDIELSSQLNGVSCSAPNEVILAGAGGQKQRLTKDGWVNDFAERPFDDFHAAWAEGDGVSWVVGGDFLIPASPGTPRNGVVARFSSDVIADTIDE